MRAAIAVVVIFVASLGSVGHADEAERVLGMALAEAQLGHCQEALAHLDQYLAATANPSPDAFEVLRRCPRTKSTPPPPAASAPPQPTPTPAPAAHKPRRRWFLIDVELGVSVPLTSGVTEAQLLGAVELGVALSNRIGLDLVLLAESLVSRADVGLGGAFKTVFSENLLVGVEERRVVWRKLSVFGTVAGGILVDSYKGFEPGGAIHVDAGAGWTLGPGDIRVRPVDFAMFVSDAFGISWRVTAGYALRF